MPRRSHTRIALPKTSTSISYTSDARTTMNIRRLFYTTIGIIFVNLAAVYTLFFYFGPSIHQIERCATVDTQEASSVCKLPTVDLTMQKHHFSKQQQNRLESLHQAVNESKLVDFQMFIVPQLSCPTMVRLGRFGDGGKWVCNPWRLRENCTLYSFGVAGDTDFEQEFYELSGRRCKIFCVDSDSRQAKELFEPFEGVFITGYITEKTDKERNALSLVDFMKHHGHKKVDIVKMDIEGSEFPSLKGLFRDTNITNDQSNICQLLIEFHYYGNLNLWIEALGNLEERGFLMYSKEANMRCHECFEFSFMHKTCLEQYGLSADMRFARYF